MPDIDTIFDSGGEWLKAADIDDDTPLTIEGVELKEMADGKVKPLLSFGNYDKKLVCNWTNAQRIAEAYGKDTDGWIGKLVTLYPDRVKFQGKLVGSISVRVPKTKRNSPNKVARYDERNPPPADDFDEPVPF